MTGWKHQITTLAAEDPGAASQQQPDYHSPACGPPFSLGPEAVCATGPAGRYRWRHLPLVVHVESCATGGSSICRAPVTKLLISALRRLLPALCSNVQEVVDFTLVARRVAERTLLPGLVFMDGEQTAASFQQAALPSWQLIKAPRPADDLLPCSGLAEKLLFGDERRRVPRWHDIDRPVLLGAAQPAGLRGLGKPPPASFWSRM